MESNVRLLPFILGAEGEGGRQLRFSEMRSFTGNNAWRYSSVSIHFTNKSLKKYVSLFFGDLFQLNR
jgi:hypothetical protein